jgi:hypothetical protein
MSKAIILNQAASMKTAAGDTGPISWGNASQIALDINVTGQQGTSPTLQILLDRLGADGVTYFPIYDSTALPPGSYPKSASIGPGCTFAQELGLSGRVRWNIGGSASPGIQFSLSLQGE